REPCKGWPAGPISQAFGPAAFQRLHRLRIGWRCILVDQLEAARQQVHHNLGSSSGQKIKILLMSQRWRRSHLRPNSGNLAGAPGFEPGNAGIKIRCLTTWLRPNMEHTAL